MLPAPSTTRALRTTACSPVTQKQSSALAMRDFAIDSVSRSPDVGGADFRFRDRAAPCPLSENGGRDQGYAGNLDNMLTMVERFSRFRRLGGCRPADASAAAQGRSRRHHSDEQYRGQGLGVRLSPLRRSGRAAEVEAAQARVVAARNRVSRFAQMASSKTLVAERTGDKGWLRMRPPLCRSRRTSASLSSKTVTSPPDGYGSRSLSTCSPVLPVNLRHHP